MNKALDNDCFFSALSLALTLPDICGKAKYPTDGNKKRYIAWYDEYVGAYEQCPGEEGKMPYLSGEVVYQLRCSFLHQGNPNIDKGKINEECCKIDKFVLLTEKKKEFNILSDSASSSEQFWGDKKIGDTYRTYEVNVRRLCFTLMVDDTIIEALNYNALVTDESGIKKIVDDIEKKYNDRICGGI